MKISIVINFFKIAIVTLIVVHSGEACATNNLDSLAKRTYWESMASNKHLSATACENALDSLISLAPQEISFSLKKLEIYKRQGTFNKLVKTCNDLLSHHSLSAIDTLCYIYNERAKAFMVMNRFKESLSDCIRLFRLDKPDSLHYYDVHLHLTIAAIFGKTGYKNLRHAFLLRAKTIANSIDTTQIDRFKLKIMQSSLMHLKAIEEYDNNHFDDALLIMRRALDNSPSPIQSNYIAQNIATVLANDGRWEMALAYLNNLELENDGHFPYILKADILNHLGRYHESLSLLSDKLNIDSIIAAVPDRAPYLYSVMAEALSGAGRWKEAYGYRSSQAYILDSINSVCVGQSDYATFDHGTSQSSLRNNIYLIGIVLIIFLIIGILFFKIRKKPITADSGLIQTETKSDTILNAVDNILKKSDIPAALKVNYCRDIIDRNSSQNLTSEKLRPFALELTKRHPTLSNAEIEIAQMVACNLSSKEIASATNRSVRTVDATRYNLRKKLGIIEKTDIYLKRLLDETS